MVNEKIQEIKELLNARQTLNAKKLLDELGVELEKTEKLEKFFDEIKGLIMNLGKSNMLSKSEIQEVINNYEK